MRERRKEREKEKEREIETERDILCNALFPWDSDIKKIILRGQDNEVYTEP